MLPLIPLAIQVAPQIARWLFGGDSKAQAVTQQVTQVVQAVTGTSDPDTAQALLQAKPELATQLGVQLAQIAAARQAEEDAASQAAMSAQLADVAGARAQTVQLAGQHSTIAWGAPLVSVVVLVAFAGTLYMAFTQQVQPGQQSILDIMIGTLATMAVSVVSYWVGSSAGSANKTASNERMAVASMQSAASQVPLAALSALAAPAQPVTADSLNAQQLAK